MADDDRRSVGVRVRPNSHDFIRQLRQDLSTKKYTFYVNVGAKTTQATRDVREWARVQLQAIHAAVPVSANTGPATRDMADWRRRQAGIVTTIKIHADTSEALREIEALRAMARDITIKVRADTSRAAARAASSGGGRSRASNIDKEFQAAFSKSTKKEMEDFAKIAAGIKLDVDDKPATAKIKKVKAEAEKPIKTPLELEVEDARRQLLALKIQEKSRKLQIGVNYDATDIKQMKLVMAKLRLQEQANDITIGVRVSRSSLERIKDAQIAIRKQFGSATLIRSLDFGPLNLGKPSGLIGTISSLTLLAGALPGAVAGVTALSDALIRLSGAAGLVPGAIGAIAASMATLTVGTKGIGDAFTSLFAMWDEGASQQGKASTKLISAQNNYKDAVVAEGRAQERVATARRQALGELRNLNNELRGGVLNEAQSLLDLQKARDRYAQGDFENQTDRLQAQLDIQRAELNVSNVREDNIALQQKANDANVKGVEGSDEVRDALDAQRKATEAVTEATQAMTAGGAGATTAAQKFADQLAQLSPNARDFVETIAGMKDELYGFRNAIQDTIFQGAGPAFKDMFNELLPIIQPGMEQIAAGMNQNLLQVFDTLKSPDGQSIIERILGGTAETQKALTGLINPLIKGVGTLVAAGTEKMPQVIEMFTRFADRFAIFIEKADKDGSLDKFFDKGIGAMADMVEIGLNLIQIVNDLSEAFGGNVLTNIKHMTDGWHEFLSSEEGQRKLKQFLQDATDLWEKWKPILMELPGLFQTLSDSASNVLGVILPIVENIFKFLNKIPGALEVIGTALITSMILGRFSALAKTVGVIYEALKGMPGLIQKIPGLATTGLPGGVGPVPGAAPSVLGAGVGPAVVAQPALAVAAGAIGIERLVSFLSETTPESRREQRKLLSRRGVGALLPDDPVAWIDDAKDPAEKERRTRWVAANVPEDKLSEKFTPPKDYLTGGYTDWGASRGQMAMLHGGEYVEPKRTVDHYGVDAMKAVHDKRAVISFQGGGAMPLANPNWDWGPWPFPGRPNVGVYVPTLPRQPMVPPIGSSGGPPQGGVTTGGGAHGIGPGAQIPFGPGGEGSRGSEGGIGWQLGRSPFRPLPQKKKTIHSYQDGGLVWDPNLQQFVQTGGAVSHGQNPTQGGPGLIDTVAGAVTQGVATAGNVASQATAIAQGAAQGAQGVAAGQGTGPAPGPAPAPAAPGMAPTPGTPGFTTGSPFGDAFIGAFGIPGIGTQGQGGPGWGENGPPVGLGGGEDGFDIRNFGIGPGPPGSGPADWAKFAGETLGTFGSGMFTTLAGGVLDFFGLSGVMSNIQAGGGIAGHFLGGSGGGKAQGPGAAQTNADVTDLLNTAANMPGNPAYPGLPNLPSVIDLATGSATGGLQTNTARGKATIQKYFPWATNIGGVRKDSLKWHPMGLALDVMTDPGHGNNDPPSPEGLAKGNQLYAWLKEHQAELGIDYLLWQEKDHYNHIHVNFAPSGYGPNNGPATGLSLPKGGTAKQGNWGSWQPPKPLPPGNNKALPNMPPGTKVPTLEEILTGTHDRGGWLMPGVSLVSNMTGRPELVIPGFQGGGYNFPTGAIPFKPRPPDILTKVAPPPIAAPKPSVPSITPSAPPGAPTAPGAPPGAAPAPVAPQGPSGGQISTAPPRPATGPGVKETGDHVHPALRKGITSGFATAGNLASTAISIAASLGGASIGGAGGSALGAAGGGIGGFVSGLFQQAGKIANNAANVASSFLVGNITGGTTENPYGVTQRSSVPRGGTKVIDASNNQYGDVYTNNLDEYFKMVDRRNSQKAQSGLGRWGTQV